jgi:hypothetical protein
VFIKNIRYLTTEGLLRSVTDRCSVLELRLVMEEARRRHVEAEVAARVATLLAGLLPPAPAEREGGL